MSWSRRPWKASSRCVPSRGTRLFSEPRDVWGSPQSGSFWGPVLGLGRRPRRLLAARHGSDRRDAGLQPFAGQADGPASRRREPLEGRARHPRAEQEDRRRDGEAGPARRLRKRLGGGLLDHHEPRLPAEPRPKLPGALPGSGRSAGGARPGRPRRGHATSFLRELRRRLRRRESRPARRRKPPAVALPRSRIAGSLDQGDRCVREGLVGARCQLHAHPGGRLARIPVVVQRFRAARGTGITEALRREPASVLCAPICDPRSGQALAVLYAQNHGVRSAFGEIDRAWIELYARRLADCCAQSTVGRARKPPRDQRRRQTRPPTAPGERRPVGHGVALRHDPAPRSRAGGRPPARPCLPRHRGLLRRSGVRPPALEATLCCTCSRPCPA